jgi:(heptosyl)LPS beta-1,4-glucosyltransferase
MNTLSVVLIAYNAAEYIHKSLESAQWADEIVVLDRGSEDNTLEIAEKFGAKCFQHTDWQGFGVQRQIAQSYANSDYIFMLDTDEQISDQLKQSILEIIEGPQKVNIAYSCSRRNWFIGKYMKTCGWYPDRVIRLYLRQERQYNSALVHESLDISGAQVYPIKGDILHHTAPDLLEFQHKQLRYAKSWAIDRYQNGQTCGLSQAFSHSLTAFLKTYVFRKGFLDGRYGLLLSTIICHYTFNKYAALWALSQRKD